MIVQPVVQISENPYWTQFRAYGILNSGFTMCYSFGDGINTVSGRKLFRETDEDCPITGSLVFVLPEDGSGRMPSYSNCEYIGQLYAGGAEGRMFQLHSGWILG